MLSEKDNLTQFTSYVFDVSISEIFSSLNIQEHTIKMMKAHYTKAMKYLDAVSSQNKEPLILFSEKLMERIS